MRFLICAAVLMLTACTPDAREIARTPNASGQIDAVIAVRETGATVATPSEIYIVSKGQAISGEAVFRADNVEGLQVVWSSDVALTIRADKARVFLRKSTQRVDADSKAQQVEVRYEIREER